MQRVYVSTTEKNVKIVLVNGIKPDDLPITIKSYPEALEAAKIKRLSRGYLIQRVRQTIANCSANRQHTKNCFPSAKTNV